jgi:Mor family transcriptional regulator
MHMVLPMNKPKTERNSKIVAAFEGGDLVATIAKRHRLSWTRVKKIIDEHRARGQLA